MTVAFEHGTTRTTTTDAKGCYGFKGVEVSQQGTITIGIPAQP
jgi:hypothetical protein